MESNANVSGLKRKLEVEVKHYKDTIEEMQQQQQLVSRYLGLVILYHIMRCKCRMKKRIDRIEVDVLQS